MSGSQPDQPGQPQPFGSMPPPDPYEATRAPLPPAPTEVQRASTILYVTVGLSLLSLVYAIATRDSSEDAIREANTALTDSEVSAAATLGIVFATVFAIGFGILYILCARKMLEGRNWARVTPTVLISIGLAFGVLNLVTGTLDGIALVTQVISLLLAIGFLFFAWSKPSSQFFAAAGNRP